MSKSPQPPAKNPEESAATSPPQAGNEVPSDPEDVANVIRQKVQRGELSPSEARHLLEYLNKELDA